MRMFVLAGAAALIAASPSMAVTFNLGGGANPNDDAVLMSFDRLGLTLNARGFTYNGPPGQFPLGTDGTTAANIHQTDVGIGVCPSARDDQCSQVDSNRPMDSEGLFFALASGLAFSIDSVVVSIIDPNDTMQVAGRSGGVYTDIGYDGTIRTGFGGAVAFDDLGGSTYRLYLNTGAFNQFAFGQARRGGGDEPLDGFRINSISLSIAPPSAVPEPASWALMIGGFGAIGGALRGRRKMAVSFG